jgi:hypothetical protein
MEYNQRGKDPELELTGKLSEMVRNHDGKWSKNVRAFRTDDIKE